MNDTQTEDTDKPTNPWLELILESNKNEKEPTKLWNLVQDEIARGTPLRLDDQHVQYNVRCMLGVHDKLAFRIFRDIGASEDAVTINLGNIEFFDVNFQNAKFKLPVDFTNNHFKKAVIFKDACFCKEADFTDCIFDKAVSFDQTRFGEFAMFKNAKFALSSRSKENKQKMKFEVKLEGNANFENTEFKGPLEFHVIRSERKGHKGAGVWFSNAVFCKDVSFLNGSFDVADFSRAVFEESAYFHHVHFHGETNFKNVNFMKWIWFGAKESDFTNVSFHTEVSFHDVICECKAVFANVQFKKERGFENAQLGAISFHDCDFSSKLNFAGASIEDKLKLHSFDATLNLRGTNFVNRPPELFGSDLKPDSDLAFMLSERPNPNHINIYEDLRQHAERLGKLEEKKRFVHAELSCRAIDPQKSPAERFVWWLYYITSDYGTFIYRPLGWLFVLFLISALPWLEYAIWFLPMSVWSALCYNILQAVPLTGHLLSALLKNFPELPMSLYFIAGPVALLDPIFWFLIGLGMRYKLRLAR